MQCIEETWMQLKLVSYWYLFKLTGEPHAIEHSFELGSCILGPESTNCLCDIPSIAVPDLQITCWCESVLILPHLPIHFVPLEIIDKCCYTWPQLRFWMPMLILFIKTPILIWNKCLGSLVVIGRDLCTWGFLGKAFWRDRLMN